MKSPTTKFASTFDVFTDVYKAGNTLHGGYFPMLQSRHRSMISSYRFEQEVYLSSYKLILCILDCGISEPPPAGGLGSILMCCCSGTSR